MCISSFVTVVLTFDLVLELAVSLVYSSYILYGRNFIFGVWMHLLMVICIYHFWVTVALTSDQDFRIIMP